MLKRILWLLAGALLAVIVLLLVRHAGLLTPATEATFAPQATFAPEATYGDAMIPSPTPEETPPPTSTPSPSPTARPATPPPDIRETVAATCEQGGYTRVRHGADERITIEDETPPLGHDYGAWTEDPETGEAVRTCARCGAEERRSAAALPRISLTGDLSGMGKAERVILGFDYRDQSEAFSCFAYTSWQGHSTLGLEKKNYTVRLFDDEALTVKHRMQLRPGWQLEHKYILKANYWDISQCRNLVCADIWADMAETRPGLNPRLRETSHMGAVDGFPVELYINGDFAGLYTLNLHKDDDLYAMRKGEREAVMICNAQTMDESLFRAPAAFETDVSDWEIEFCGTEDDNQWVKDSFNALIDFVMNADDAAFAAELSSHLDVDAAIDYLICIYALGLTDSAAKDLVLLDYGDGLWTASVYDMENAFGLLADGSAARPASEWLPEKRDGAWDSHTDSLLWDRLLNAFEDRIMARYNELRETVLTGDGLAGRVNAFMDAIPETALAADRERYPERGALDDPRQQMLDYIRERLPLLDAALGRKPS